MTNDLRTALQDLANTGADHAGPATILAGRATNRVTAHRRRRRAVISAATIAGMAAVGTGAAAAISYFGHDRVSTFPDRLVPGVVAPAPLTGLLCDAEVGDLTASTTPFVLGNEMAMVGGDAPAVINVEAASIVPMFLTNTTADGLTVTMTEGSGVYLVQDGRVVAAPVRSEAAPTDAALDPDQDEFLVNDPVAACDAAAGIPAGDYQAYGSIEVTVTGGAHSGTYDVVGGPWNVVVPGEGATAGGTDAQGPVVDPAATFPQCGAMLVVTEQLRPVRLSLTGEAPMTTGEQTSVPLEIVATNTTADHLRGSAGPVTLAVVQDGVVVGTASEITTDDGGTVDLDPSASLTTPARLDYTACSPGTVSPGWLPVGEYSVWGAQSFTVTERNPVASDGRRGATTVVAEKYEGFNEVAKIWIEEGGQPVIPVGP